MPAPVGVARIDRVERGATMTNGMSWCAASTASEYVPILFAVSPLAAIRSAPVTTTSTSPAAISEPAAASAITACGNPDRLELPRGEPRALQQRPRLVDEHALERPLLPRGAQRAERGAVAAGGEAAGVAVRERARARREQLRGLRGHTAAAVDLFGVEARARSGVGSLAQLRERPGEIDRGRPRLGRPALGRGTHVLAAPGGEREPVRGGDANQRRAAHG